MQSQPATYDQCNRARGPSSACRTACAATFYHRCNRCSDSRSVPGLPQHRESSPLWSFATLVGLQPATEIQLLPSTCRYRSPNRLVPSEAPATCSVIEENCPSAHVPATPHACSECSPPDSSRDVATRTRPESR